MASINWVETPNGPTVQAINDGRVTAAVTYTIGFGVVYHVPVKGGNDGYVKHRCPALNYQVCDGGPIVVPLPVWTSPQGGKKDVYRALESLFEKM